MEKTVFRKPVPCLYHGSMVQYHGDALVFGPLVDGAYRVHIDEDVVLVTHRRESFTVNDSDCEATHA